jgi:sulfur carrier protein ThiS
VAGVVVMARLLGDKIVIEEDTTDKPLLDALLQRGVPRESILLAYDGDIVPEELAWYELKTDVRPV